MTDFLLELRSEEIPARMQDKAREDLARLFTAELDKAGLKAAELVTYATPRRLTLIARDLPAQTAAASEELKGPPADAPDAAIDGFLRKAGLTRDALETRDVKGRATLFAVIDKPGRDTAQVLAEAIPAIIRAFPWPKSMRWGEASLSTESQRWVRPLQGIVALFGDDVVECEVASIKSGAATVGHRFHHPGIITIGSAADYVEKLRACHVIVDQSERRVTIAVGAKMAANMAGLTLVEDEGLLIENAGLTEWPVPLLGRFDEAFLDVPPEVIQLTARVNQKYFVCNDADGKLANAFICTANIDAADGGDKIVEGNQKVLAARLSDARFFYETDLKTKLDDLHPKLEKIVFHEKLGTVADKVDRVAKLARWLVEEGIVGGSNPSSATTKPVTPAKAGVSGEGAGQEPHEIPASAGMTLADQAERAARLAKADLVTGMVGEFPELQGMMGGYYAAAQGEDPAVAEAIRDHYKPVGQGDDVPTAPVTVAVSLADKLDTIVSFFLIQQQPTGSRDPFALRRAALGAIRQILHTGLRFELALSIIQSASILLKQAVGRIDTPEVKDCVQAINATKSITGGNLAAFVSLAQPALTAFKLAAAAGVGKAVYMSDQERSETVARDMADIVVFFVERLIVQQRESGMRGDVVRAVFDAADDTDLVRLLARVRALQGFMATDDGANLLAGYKRAANILKKEGYGSSDQTRHPGLVPGSTAQQETAARQQGWPPEPVRGDDESGASVSTQKPLSYTPETEEAALIAALDTAAPTAQSAVEAEKFEDAMAALATLRAPIDAFFDKVTVNDSDPAKREARLALLARMRDAVHRVADFSKIEG